MSSGKSKKGSPLRRRLLWAILSVMLLALAVSCAVTIMGLRSISRQTVEASNASNDAILTEVRNGFYQADLSLRLSAAHLGAKTLTGSGDPESLLDEAIARMQDVDMLMDDVVFLARNGELLAVRAVFPDSIGSYDAARMEALLSKTIDADPAAYGVESAPGETYTGILDYSARVGGVAAYSADETVMLVIQPGENGMQLGILTPDIPSSLAVQVLRDTAEEYQSKAQQSIAETRRELVGTLALIWLGMAAAFIVIARKTTAVLATPVEREQLEQEYALKKAEDEKRALAEVDRLKTEFLGNISHELKTPLTVMSGCAQDSRTLLRRGGDSRDAVDRNMRVITAEADRLALMVSQLLDVTAIDEGRICLNRENISPTQLISDTLNTYYPMFSGRGNTVTFRREDSPASLFCDGARIKQVLINLLANATRHTQNGLITVTLSRDGDDAVFSVADDGQGISPRLLPHIFDRYERGEEKAGDGRNTGTGLGLYICRYFVEAHGGHITARSTPGAGTVISFTVPLQSAPSEKDTFSPA